MNNKKTTHKLPLSKVKKIIREVISESKKNLLTEGERYTQYLVVLGVDGEGPVKIWIESDWTRANAAAAEVLSPKSPHRGDYVQILGPYHDGQTIDLYNPKVAKDLLKNKDVKVTLNKDNL